MSYYGDCFFCEGGIYEGDEIVRQDGEIAHFDCAEDEWEDE